MLDVADQEKPKFNVPTEPPQDAEHPAAPLSLETPDTERDRRDLKN